MTERVLRGSSKPFPVRLSHADRERLKRASRAVGEGPYALAARLVREGIDRILKPPLTLPER